MGGLGFITSFTTFSILVIITGTVIHSCASSLLTYATKNILMDISRHTGGRFQFIYWQILSPETHKQPNEFTSELFLTLSQLHIPAMLFSQDKNETKRSFHQGFTKLSETVVAVCADPSVSTRRIIQTTHKLWPYNVHSIKFVFLPWTGAPSGKSFSYRAKLSVQDFLRHKIEIIKITSHSGLERLVVVADCAHCPHSLRLIRGYGYTLNHGVVANNVIKYSNQLFPDFSQNFYGAVVTALIGLTSDVNPFTFASGGDSVQQFNPGLKALQFIGEHLNFSVNVRVASLVRYKLQGKSPIDGYVGDLVRNNKLMVGIGYAPMSLRSDSRVQNSRSYLSHYIGMMLKLQHKIGSWTTAIVIVDEGFQVVAILTLFVLSAGLAFSEIVISPITESRLPRKFM